ncbi:MAG: Flp pilus assembly complex ATPase component TadA [Armatimonadetes bacterium]|nr:Flp pilus assembly complex ATPase component TadA [Armatimonadota bacterium]
MNPHDAELKETLARLTEAIQRLNGEVASNLPYSLEQLLQVLIKHKGSFLHINCGCPAMLRINEDLVPIGEHILSAAECRTLLNSVLTPEQRKLQAQGQELDFNYMSEEGGFRFHVYLERGVPGASVRKLRTDIPRLVELGLSGGAVEKFLSQSQGLMLLTGTPRSGKINTFAAMVAYINKVRRVRIVTIEPKIQFWHQNEEGFVIQREIGSDTRSFRQAVMQAVMQDPDILAVGAIPDTETLEVLLQAAAGGHLVLAMLDAVNCARAVDELIAALQSSDARMTVLLAHVLRLVVCQHLVGRADGRGLLPVMEILECIPEVQEMVARGSTTDLHQAMYSSGMQTVARHLSRMVEVGSVTLEEALKLVDRDELEIQQVPAELPTEARADEETPLMSWL